MLKKQTSWTAFLVLLHVIFILGGCHKMLKGYGLCKSGEGGVIEEKLLIKHFRGMELAISANVYISQGQNQKVVVKGHKNIVEALDRKVIGGNWQISTKGDECYTDYELDVYIVTSDLDAVRISGSGDVYIDNFSDQKGNLLLNISGSGDIKLEKFDGIEKLTVEINGSGDIEHKYKGEVASFVNDIYVNINGSGNYSSYGVDSRYCSINIAGSGDALVSVSEKLHVNIVGSGDVLYTGDPSIKVDIVGSGSVINKNK